MKKTLDFFLTKFPKLYAAALKFKPRRNFEKIVFLKNIRRGEVVLDVGAHHGYYTLLFSHVVGPRGQVHAFEPVPVTFQTLSENTRAGRYFENIFLNPAAAGNQNGSVSFYVPGEDFGQASMKKHGEGSWKNAPMPDTYASHIIRLDDYAESHFGDKKVDFVKMDIEGAELEALKGFEKTILRDRPKLYLEVCRDWTKDFGYEPVELVRFLKRLGYRKFWLVTGELRFLEDPEEALSRENLPASANLLCEA
jgi:FkbM family methyltransferase